MATGCPSPRGSSESTRCRRTPTRTRSCDGCMGSADLPGDVHRPRRDRGHAGAVGARITRELGWKHRLPEHPRDRRTTIVICLSIALSTISHLLVVVLGNRGVHRRAAAGRRRRRSSSASATPASSRWRRRASTQLDAEQKALAYWLTQASIAIDPIIYDQLSRFGLRRSGCSKAIVAHPPRASRRDVREDPRVHDAVLGQPRQPQRDHGAEVSADVHASTELQDAALKAQANGAFKTAHTPICRRSPSADAEEGARRLQPSLFDPRFEPMIDREDAAGRARTSCRPAPTISTTASRSPI